ncbi:MULTISPECIES: aminoglycoside 6-adenylyltransferase [unclassified Nocardia]|uniref:aminoglycoside 6-adenylyltransferase n=1 Tax=unclassified Nocardia TaxID=2637762 RepID=UPI001CE3E536|nr:MULTISPECIES: aminoglycoside 6-adenylyltransferase [unclassified Nocardia]
MADLGRSSGRMAGMEDPEQLLKRILEFAADDPGIRAVIQTGSRARGTRIDEFSDLDLEFIGPGAKALVGDDAWAERIAPVLVGIHLANDEEDEPDWPTYLVVFAEGRKVDFTLADTARLTELRDELDELYERGYRVLLDKDGLAAGLPTASGRPRAEPPTAAEFETNQREFWFEATQVPIYAARGDLWHAQLRVAELRELLLTMLEWQTAATSSGQIDTWHAGHHVDEWVAAPLRDRTPAYFPAYQADSIVDAVRAMATTYATATAEAAEVLGHTDLRLRDRVLAHIERIGSD